jgi:hypothetical protein
MGMAPLLVEEDYWWCGDDIHGNNFIQCTMSQEAYHEIKKLMTVDVEELIWRLNEQFQCF